MLKLNNINKYYSGQQVLKNVSLRISEGSCFGLIGPNGAGKSTLIKIISSIIHEYQGEVRFSKEDIRIGYVPQDISLEETVTAQENLYFFGKLQGLRGKVLKKRSKEILSQIGLEKQGNNKIQTFSGGMKRRLNIGCALLNQPEFIILDEPTVGVDPQSRRYIFNMIERLKEDGCTIIYTSHYVEEVERLCDEVAFIDHGEIIEINRTDHILREHAIPSVFVKGTNCYPKELHDYGDVREEDGGYFVVTTNPLPVMEKVLSYSRNHNGELERLELVKPRLEDVFLSLTGSKLRD